MAATVAQVQALQKNYPELWAALSPVNRLKVAESGGVGTTAPHPTSGYVATGKTVAGATEYRLAPNPRISV